MHTLVLGITLLVTGLSAQAEVSPLMYFTENRLPVEGDFKAVYEIDLENFTARVIYTSDLVLRDVVSAEQSDRMIVHATNYETGDKEVHLIKRNGELVEKFQDGVSAVFVDAAGSNMVYTRGELNKNLLTESRGTWLQDLSTGEEKMIAETGLYLEWASFNRSLYISNSGEGGDGFRYLMETGEIEDSDLLYGSFSPAGAYRWGYMTWGGVYIKNWETDEIVSTEFELLKTRRHATPLYWMSDSLAMLPHYKLELEDYLLYVETGRTLKAPGRVLSVTNDEKYVYVCKPGLVIEKVAMGELEVLYEGKGETSPADGEASADVE